MDIYNMMLPGWSSWRCWRTGRSGDPTPAGNPVSAGLKFSRWVGVCLKRCLRMTESSSWNVHAIQLHHHQLAQHIWPNQWIDVWTQYYTKWLTGIALHQDVSKSILALSATAAGPHGHRSFLVGIIRDFGTGAQALKVATLRTKFRFNLVVHHIQNHVTHATIVVKRVTHLPHWNN